MQEEGLRGVQHLEAVRLRVREQKELLSAANKELRCLKKTVKAFEVLCCFGLSLLYVARIALHMRTPY